MRHLFGVSFATLAIVAVSSLAHAGQAAKTMHVRGTVSAVSPEFLTVKGKTGMWTFTIDKDTTVNAKGATHKSLALKEDGKASTLIEFLKMGDTVRVAYHEEGAAKHAAIINVTSQGSVK